MSEANCPAESRDPVSDSTNTGPTRNSIDNLCPPRSAILTLNAREDSFYP